ncbi:MAG: hypothetical protein LBE89_02925 [Helicobacteraceae bacterium]|nr:hypothetical protein [Helicobacteraceae bacterium]
MNCFYPAQTIVEAYADFRKSGIEENSNDPGYTNLRAKLEIGKDVKDTYDYVAINYEWNGDKTFVVKMFYVGGETDVKFTQDRNGTRATMIFSPD